MKKLIGLTGPSSFTNECIQMIEKQLNANFILLYHENQINLAHWLDKCDAFVVAGGVDIHPTVYETDMPGNQNLSKFNLKRDTKELLVIDHALEYGKPMFGICRGHQMIGIFLGLKSAFCMDLSNSKICHQASKVGISLNKDEPCHRVKIIGDFPIKESPERAILRHFMEEESENTIWVNSFHHQGIFYDPVKFNYNELGISVLGIAPVEIQTKRQQIIELMRGNSWISCQWHPEYDYEENTSSLTIIETFKGML